MHHYRESLQHARQPTDSVRISEKLAYSLFLGGNPHLAKPFFETALAAHLQNPSDASKAVEMLLQQARQSWLAQGDETMRLYRQAVKIAKQHGDTASYALAVAGLTHSLIGLSRYKEANLELVCVENLSQELPPSIRADIFIARGCLSAAAGQADEAFHWFDAAVETARKGMDVFQIVSVWNLYGHYALILGKTGVAKVLHERALLVARQFNISWLISYCSLHYADTLWRIGQEHDALEHLREALVHDRRVPALNMPFVDIGMRIALRLNAKTILAKCIRFSTVESAFRFENPNQIAQTAAAFGQWYALQGKETKARTLLHRAALSLKNVERIDDPCEFPIAVARYGQLDDIPEIRNLLERSTLLPHCDVARASIALFDAFIAQRRGHTVEMLHHAEIAIQRFNDLGWCGYAALARPLLPTSQERTIPTINKKPPLAMAPKLTLREQQVAELLIKGLTNREIATELSITKYTVDSHVASILHRLGIRSRHQLTM